MKTNKATKYVFTYTIAFVFLSSHFMLGQSAELLKKRRQTLSAMVDKGIVIIQSTERNQSNLYEFFIPNSDNHDFIYFTGLETPNATLVLCPGSEIYPEILYIGGDIEHIKEQTGIQHVYPYKNLLPDLSNAYSDFSQLRYTQRRFKSLPSEIARILYNNGGKKVVYFNFPRFVNLNEPPPQRMKLIRRFEGFSPKYEMRDACDLIDLLRMYKDKYEIEQMRKATRISGEAMMECMKSARPGIS